MREPLRDPVHTGPGGQPRRRPWRHGCIAHGVKRSEQRRVVEPNHRLIAGAPARVEPRRRAHDGGVSSRQRTAAHDVPGMPRAAGTPWREAGTPHPDAAAWEISVPRKRSSA
jgi:hypothetical protein